VDGFYREGIIENNEIYLSITDNELHIGNPVEKSKINKTEGFIEFRNQMEGF
jgi:hypothetical protein